MKMFALIVGGIALACLGGAVRLFMVTYAFYSGPDYDRDVIVSVGGMSGDSLGIFVPCILLAVVGVFFARFAINLWRGR